MKRRIATWAVATLTVLGLSACGGSPAPEPPVPVPTTSAPAPAPVETSAPVEEAPPAEQTIAEACIAPSAKLLEANAELMKAYAALSASDGKDAQAIVDALVAMANTWGAMAESTTNPEVREALTGLKDGYLAMAELYTKLLIEEDLTAAADAMTAVTGLQKSMEDFTKLCSA